MADLKDRNSTDMIEKVISVNRVTKVTKGGKRFSFSALVVIGDQKGKVGIALGRSREVSLAIAKATNKARKNLITVAIRGTTVPYGVTGRHGASSVVIRSASKGTGLIAGGAVRAVMEVLGVTDVLTKAMGSGNPQNVVKAALNALAQLRTAQQVADLRGKTIEQLVKGDNV